MLLCPWLEAAAPISPNVQVTSAVPLNDLEVFPILIFLAFCNLVAVAALPVIELEVNAICFQLFHESLAVAVLNHIL